MKKIIIIASVILFFIIVFTLVLSLKAKKTAEKTAIQPTPTTVSAERISNQAGEPISQETYNLALSMTPYENDDFIFEYIPEEDRFIIYEKNDQAKISFSQWAMENNLDPIVADPNFITYEEVTQSNQSQNSQPGYKNGSLDSDLLISFLDIFLNLGRGAKDSQTDTSQIGDLSFNSTTDNLENTDEINTSSEKIYHSQCATYGDIPLPSSCTLCDAGCGPTTVSMIASYYLGEDYNPEKIVSEYSSRNYYLGCDGSRYQDAKAYLESKGLKTTSYMIYDYDTADLVEDDFKKYIDAGWTLFVLANFRDDGGGHFFWVTNVDDDGIWAYDPYYGKGLVAPINENNRYPFPKYRVVFGVKKT